MAEEVRDQLGLMGWIPQWQLEKDTAYLKFEVTSLAKTSKLNLNLNSGEVQVADIPKGFLAVLHGLHFFNGRICPQP